MLRLGVLVVVLFSSVTAHAQFVTYEQWRTYDKAARSAYIAGDIDGTISTLIRAPAARHFNSCLVKSDATPDSLSAAVLDFAKDKPYLQMGPVHEVLMAHLFEACGYPPEK
jgi:hypothetical protein